MKTGLYVIGTFIETATEKNQKGEFSHYAIVTMGGRRGAVGIKYNADDPDFTNFLNALSMGDEIGARVTVSAFKDNVYYTLQELMLLNEEAS